MKQLKPTQKQIEEMLYRIYKAMEDVFNPVCDKCHTKITTCECNKSA